MARIRTIKPEFFRHEGLQDLEVENPGKYPMLVFSGLWTISDKAGRFEWRPRQMKLDILPFIPFDMEETLNILMDAGFINKYEVDGKYYGIIPSFGTHQRIEGKESQAPARYPEPTEKQQGSDREAPEKQQRSQEKEKEKEKEKESIKTFLSDSIEFGLSELLFRKIFSRNPKFKKPNLQLWAKDISLMITCDTRAPDEIKKVITWCQDDPFWQNNILSTGKLRKQFDQLFLKMGSGNGNTTGNQKSISPIRGNFTTERERNNAAACAEADIIRAEYEANLAAANGGNGSATG